MLSRVFMKRVNANTAAPSVKKFLRSLRIAPDGLEVELGGEVLCKIIPPGQLSETEKTARLAHVRELLNRARARSKGVSAEVIERDIRGAIKTVRLRR